MTSVNQNKSVTCSMSVFSHHFVCKYVVNKGNLRGLMFFLIFRDELVCFSRVEILEKITSVVVERTVRKCFLLLIVL